MSMTVTFLTLQKYFIMKVSKGAIMEFLRNLIIIDAVLFIGLGFLSHSLA